MIGGPSMGLALRQLAKPHAKFQGATARANERGTVALARMG